MAQKIVKEFAQKLALDFTPNVLEKASYFYSRSLKSASNLNDQQSLVCICIELASMVLKGPFNLVEALQILGVSSSSYYIDRNKIATLLRISLPKRTLHDYGVMFGCINAVENSKELIKHYQQFYRSKSKIQQTTMDWKNEQFILAVFEATTKAMGVKLDKTMLKLVGGDLSLKKSYRASIEKESSEYLKSLGQKRVLRSSSKTNTPLSSTKPAPKSAKTRTPRTRSVETTPVASSKRPTENVTEMLPLDTDIAPEVANTNENDIEEDEADQPRKKMRVEKKRIKCTTGINSMLAFEIPLKRELLHDQWIKESLSVLYELLEAS